MEQDKQNLLEMIDRPAFVVRDGIITDRNQMAVNRQIPVGKPIWELLPEDCSAYQTYQGGILYLTLQIGWIPCGATVTRQEDGDIFLMDRDTDQAQLQALALAAQQLRVPLSNLLTVTDCLLPALQEESQQHRALQMQRALFQLMRQINNMADAERYACANTAQYENTDLCHFFREIIEKADATLGKANTTLHFTCPEKPILTLIDRELIQRAVYNLLSNAVKFSPTGSTIKVSLTRIDKLACLTIEDQGDGIAACAQGSLFHRYLREPAIEDSRFGLGLGMTLVRSAAAAHGGTVLLEQSHGTRVAMTIAIRKEAPGTLRSPQIRISDYTGGWDTALLEFSDSLPADAYETSLSSPPA